MVNEIDENGMYCKRKSIILGLLFSCVLYIVLLRTRRQMDEEITSKKYSSSLNDVYLPPKNDSDHLHWFMQVSDLHFSLFKEPQNYIDFQDFCTSYVKVIQPEVVLVTGDLTDAKTANRLGSQQYIFEWEKYRNVMQLCRKVHDAVWLDIRGNHDAFDVVGSKSRNNYFRDYSIKGSKYFHSYKYTHKTEDGDQFSFIAIDSTQKPGPKRPFNFFGVLKRDEMERLEHLTSNLGEGDGVVLFGHYPSSVIISPNQTHRQLLSKGIAYLSGHLHTAFGNHLYSRQQAGFLELELGDWVANRKFRVFAFDHGLFSFNDFHYGAWPLILPTNPLHAQFMQADKEPIDNVLKSTHIRILVFSDTKIEFVKVKINDEVLGDATHLQGPLFILHWIPQQYSVGIHELGVHAKDVSGNEQSITWPFSLDGTTVRSGLFSRFILMLDHLTTMRILFTLVTLFYCAPLLFVYFCRRKALRAINILISWYPTKWIAWILRCLFDVSSFKHIYWPLIIYIVNVTCGVWFVGEIAQGVIGVQFAYGIYVYETWIPGSTTLFYAAFHIMLFCWPFTLYLGHCIHLKHIDNPPSGVVFQTINHVMPCLYLAMYLLFGCNELYNAYGLMAAILGPVKSWTLVFTPIMIMKAKKSQNGLRPTRITVQCKVGDKIKLEESGTSR